MTLKNLFLILILLFSEVCAANMSSPVLKGTMTSTAYASKDIDIISESIYLRIDQDYKTAKYIVEYNIKSDISGTQIPFLFYAKDLLGDFNVSLDGENIKTEPITADYIHLNPSPFQNFQSGFGRNSDSTLSVQIKWNSWQANNYKFSDLVFFETNIRPGVHKIRVEYTATVWTDIGSWLKKYSFRYSLSPTKFWKSFGTFKLIVEQKGQLRPITSNLGLPIEKEIARINTWTFDKLPDEYFEIAYTTKPSMLVSTLIAINPIGIGFIIGFLLLLLHILILIKLKQKNQTHKINFLIKIGSFIVPFIMLIAFMYSFIVIDDLIGEEASKRHGYTFMMFFFYPIMVIIYLMLIKTINHYILKIDNILK